MTVPGTPSAIETTRTTDFRLAVDYQLQEQSGKLWPLVGSHANYSDKLGQIEDRFDDVLVREVVTRNGDTVTSDIDVERRWIVKPRRQNVAVLIDKDDMLSTKIELKSPIAVQTARAIRRAHDGRWLQGFYGNAYTGEGESSLTAVPFKSANILASSSAGITKNKLIAMRELIATRLVDTEAEMPIMLITAKQVTDLLKINEVVSRDYNPAVTLALQNGEPTPFMGFRFIQTELGNSRVYPDASTLTVNGSSERLNPVFVPSGMHGGTWLDFEGYIDRRPDKNQSIQVYGETVAAATRVNEDKCFIMANVES
jgi:hypothetical protein